MPKITLTEMKKRDLSRAIETAIACFGPGLAEVARWAFAASLSKDALAPKTFLAKDGAKVVGTVQSINGYVAPNLCGLAWLCVLPPYRRRGIARRLLAHAEKDAVQNLFHGRAGTFFLLAYHSPAYYRRLGYTGRTANHDGAPFLVKQYTPKKA